MKRISAKSIVTISCIVVVAVLFYLLNALTPICLDDFSYTRNFVTKAPISSVADICQSMGIHYLKVNGRLVVHFLAQLFLWWGKPVFNIINTAAFLGLGTLIYLMAAGTFKDFKVTRWLLGLFGIWLLAPGFGQSYLWLTGAANYLYGILIILAFLIPFRRGVSFKKKAMSVLFPVLFFVAGILAGWTNESTGAALLLVVVCFIVKERIENGKFSFWMFAGFVGNLAGFAVMVLAPGQTARLTSYGESVTLSLLFHRALHITRLFVTYFWPALLVFVVLLVFYFVKMRENNWKGLVNTGIFALATLVSSYSMVIAPYFPERAWSGTVIFGMITVVSLLSAFKIEIKHAAAIRSAAAICLSVLFLFTYIRAYSDVRVAWLSDTKRMTSAGQQIAEGKKNVTMPSVTSTSKYSCFEPWGDLSDDTANWVNSAIARYLGVNTVTKEVS